MKAQELIKFIREESLVPATIYKDKGMFTIKLGTLLTEPMTQQEILNYIQVLNITHPTRNIADLIKSTNGVSSSFPVRVPMSKRGVLAAELQ